MGNFPLFLNPSLKLTYRVSKKNAPLCLTGHRGYQKWTINKSRVSFEKFRKFSFLMSTKTPNFCQKMTEKNESKDAYPP